MSSLKQELPNQERLFEKFVRSVHRSAGGVRWGSEAAGLVLCDINQSRVGLYVGLESRVGLYVWGGACMCGRPPAVVVSMGFSMPFICLKCPVPTKARVCTSSDCTSFQASTSVSGHVEHQRPHCPRPVVLVPWTAHANHQRGHCAA